MSGTQIGKEKIFHLEDPVLIIFKRFSMIKPNFRVELKVRFVQFYVFHQLVLYKRGSFSLVSLGDSNYTETT